MPIPMLRRLALFAALAVALPLAAEAQQVERACERAARDMGFDVLDFGRARELYSGEKLSGYAMLLQVRRDRERDVASANCVFRIATGGASIVKVYGDRREDADRRQPSERETQAACTRTVERRGFRIQRVGDSRILLDDRRNEVGRLHFYNVRRDGRDWRVECSFGFRSGDTRIDVFRR